MIPRLPRWFWLAGAVLLILLVGAFVARAKVERYLADRLEAQRATIQAETHELKTGLIAERQALELERQAATAEKAAADAKKREAEAQTAELRGLLDHLRRFDAARQQAREDVAHVPDAELDSRIRAALARLRGAPGPGGRAADAR